MLTVRGGLVLGLSAEVLMLAVLGMTVGLTGIGWLVAATCGVVMCTAVARGVARNGADVLGPADLVTLLRATFACGVAALVGDAFVQQPAVTALIALSATALALDAVDGWVARSTRTVSTFGARFDGEIDAFLILVLSVYVAGSFGAWVLLIGAVRYAFGAAGWAMPWMRRQLPPRYWRKVVAGVQGVVLTVAAADVLPRVLTYAVLGVAFALLAESFGRDVLWLWRRRRAEDGELAELAGEDRAAGRRWSTRAVVAVVANVLALLLVWFALLCPNQTYRLTPSAFLRIPVEGLVVVGLALLLPSWARRTMAAVVGVLLGLLTIGKILDMGFFAAFDRPFNLVTDRGYFGPAVDLVRDTVGPVGATTAVITAVAVVLGLLVCLPLAVGRLTRLIARNRSMSLRG
ncbi:MAG: CDP-alcohol phosphatidyltransferase family protein, partial [Nocardioidaceae bacterium]